MNYFFIGLAICFGALAVAAFVKLEKLEKKLKAKGILEEDWDKNID